MSEKSIAVRTASTPTSLRLVEPWTVLERVSRMYETIARRGFQIFEGGGGLFGRDLDHWLNAEAELLHPVHVHIAESGDTLAVRAEVPGFSADELEISLEPRRLTISGKKESSEEHKKGKTIYKEQCANEILRVIELPAEVNASKTTATLKNGVLELTMPKAAGAKGTRVQVTAA